LIGFQSLHNN